jgi:hypothetical protein
MDVLQYWSPTIDWNLFAQGAVSDPMWRAFKELVTLCHCVEHWHKDRRGLQMTRAPRSLYPESSHAKKKSLDERKRAIDVSDNRIHRAAHLANEKIIEMSHLTSPGDPEGTAPDFRLCAAAVLSIGRSLGHERARYKSVAFDSFDAATELSLEPDITANHWLVRAGYPDSQPQS